MTEGKQWREALIKPEAASFNLTTLTLSSSSPFSSSFSVSFSIQFGRRRSLCRLSSVRRPPVVRPSERTAARRPTGEPVRRRRRRRGRQRDTNGKGNQSRLYRAARRYWSDLPIIVPYGISVKKDMHLHRAFKQPVLTTYKNKKRMLYKHCETDNERSVSLSL